MYFAKSFLYYITLLIAIIIVAVLISITIIEVSGFNSQKLDELEVRLDGIEKRTVDTTINAIVSDPGHLFPLLDYSPEWEEIKVIPYSRCYRHLIGTSTVADYIICKAI